ncbi:MAG: ABC transporter permease [Roseivirga sp.]
MKEQPPKLPERLLAFFCSGAFLEDLLGDLHELYVFKRSTSSRAKAKRYYWYQAFRMLFSYTLVKRKRERSLSAYCQSQQLNTMLFNYVKISFRNIAKNRTFTLLNVFGLGLGMSLGLLGLATYVDLIQFDTFHPEAENIYRITTQVKENGAKNNFASSPPALAYLAEEQMTGVDEFVHINDAFFPTIKTIGDPIRLSGYLTEPDFLEMFDFPLAAGTKAVLEQPGMVILTHEAAQKLFGDKPAMGQSLETENWGRLQVGGVLAPYPKGTHFVFDLLSGISENQRLNESNEANWTEFHSNYLYLKSALKASQIQAQINSISQSGQAFFEHQNLEASYPLQSLLGINPGPKLGDEVGIVFDSPGMFMFFGLALLILIPACLNYGNMAVANALKRSKEIGIRKIMGSPNKQIIHQFLVETVMICMVGVLLSIFIFDLIKTELASMLVGGTSLSFALSPKLLLVFLFFAMLTGLLTGLLPALYFSRITPIKAIRNTVNNQKISISGLRKGLLVFQFVLSLAFMMGIGVLVKQYGESLNYDQGFARENVLVIPIKAESQQLVANAMSSIPAVTDMSFSSSIPGTPLGRYVYFYSADGLDSLAARVIYTDDKFIEHMGIDMQWGSGALRESPFEQVLVNEKLMEVLANLRNDEADSLLAEMADSKRVQIAGIVKNYNHEPLNQRIEPMLVRLDKSELTYALLTVNTHDITGTLVALEDRWDALFPESPFQASFLDAEIEKAYVFFLIGIKIFGFLAILAVTISCLGLLGMVIYTTENRKKEVAIRKTLGAGTMRLLYSLSGLFFRMWALALCIAIPAAYLFYDNVMLSIYNKFSGGVGFSEVALSSLFTLLLGLLAIMVQSTKIMRTNPAENLRND